MNDRSTPDDTFELCTASGHTCVRTSADTARRFNARSMFRGLHALRCAASPFHRRRLRRGEFRHPRLRTDTVASFAPLPCVQATPYIGVNTRLGNDPVTNEEIPLRFPRRVIRDDQQDAAYPKCGGVRPGFGARAECDATHHVPKVTSGRHVTTRLTTPASHF
jgi:hypothetical protein